MPIDWKNIDKEFKFKVPAKPTDGLWTLVRSYINGPTIIRLQASGRWTPIAGLPSCGADGLRHWAFCRDMLLTKKAPLGALIGKFGGSNGAADEAEIFLVGAATILSVEKAVGPLYLTINDAPAHFDDNEGEIEVYIS